MSAEIELDPRLDYQAVAPLVGQLADAKDDDLILNARHVVHVGALALQVVLSMVKARASAGQTTRLVNATDTCVDQLGLFGFSPETLTNPETWT
ncbi:STAS domain-containing protein [Aliiroseovarius sp. PTFE2010]|uniref:STAS domain-containing protein n=1 Tax=Aliiroseovarius sp. PTFE2010 TaxID=3417190 RepID=UPI003CF3692C